MGLQVLLSLILNFQICEDEVKNSPRFGKFFLLWNEGSYVEDPREKQLKFWIHAILRPSLHLDLHLGVLRELKF